MAKTATARTFRAVLLLAAAGAFQWLLWQAGSSAVVRAAGTVADPVRRSDASLTTAVVGDVAMGMVVVAGTWLVIATALTVVTQIAPAPVRRRCPSLAPRAWRRLVISLLGTGVLAIPGGGTGAAGAVDGRDVSSDRATTSGDSPLGALDGLPYPDRPSTARSAPPAQRPETRPSVVVRPGDSLWSLTAAAQPRATDAQVAQRWPRWYTANRESIGPDPDLLTPGTVLDPPGQP